MTGGWSRRRFLGAAGGVGVGAVVAGRLAWGSLVGEQVEGASPAPGAPGDTGAAGAPAAAASGRRVLVVVQCNGGNDGLNTLVPIGDGRYADARPTLRVPEADVLALAGTTRYGFHPALAPLVPLWEAGRLAAVDGVGLTGQSRSHFAAMDAWGSGRPGQPLHDGWLGRWLELVDGSPNPLRAVVLGGAASALTSARTVSTGVLDPAAFTLRTPRGVDAGRIRDAFLATAAPLASDGALAAAQAAVPSALAAVDLLARAGSAAAGDGAEGGLGRVAPTGRSSAITDLLGTAAGIIGLDLGTQVVVVVASGFDTHADQLDRHPELLADLATGIAAFHEAVAQAGRADDVLLVTTSEFGRRVAENGSGTDHGAGGVQFLLGSGVQGRQVVGEADLGALDQGDLRSLIDGRSLYANALDWLGGPTGATDEVLGAPYDRLGLVRT